MNTSQRINTYKKEVEFEINLLPVLSVLSICICFLLTTTVWNRMGFLGINQAIGDQMSSSGKIPDSILIKPFKNGNFELEWRLGSDSSTKSKKRILALSNRNPDWKSIRKEMNSFINLSAVKTVLILPEVGVAYGSAIKIIDELKNLPIDIGLGPAVPALALGGSSK